MHVRDSSFISGVVHSRFPGGNRNKNGTINNQGNNENFWSSYENSSDNAWNRNLNDDNSDLNRNNNNKRNGFSVRCLRDSMPPRQQSGEDPIFG